MIFAMEFIDNKKCYLFELWISSTSLLKLLKLTIEVMNKCIHLQVPMNNMFKRIDFDFIISCSFHRLHSQNTSRVRMHKHEPSGFVTRSFTILSWSTSSIHNTFFISAYFSCNLLVAVSRYFTYLIWISWQK